MPKIDSDYIKTGKVKYVFRDLPLESIHKNAFKAAEAASCAGDQDKFWEMHDRLFANQGTLGSADLLSHAQAIALDMSKFQQCLESGKFAPAIRKNMADASNAGITGTPAFILGVSDPKSLQVKVLKVISGAQPFAAFKDAIDNALSPQKQ
jgi:protein-disulfide isomerase